MARKDGGEQRPGARPRMRSEARLPRPEKTSMPVISTDAETVALLSARMKRLIRPTSTMM